MSEKSFLRWCLFKSRPRLVLSLSLSRSPFLSLSLSHSFSLSTRYCHVFTNYSRTSSSCRIVRKNCQNSTFLLGFLERASLHDSRNFSTIASTSLRCDHLHDPSYFRVPRDPRWHSMEVPASTHPIVRAMPFILNVAGLNGTKIRKGKTRRKGKRSETNPECTFDIAKERGRLWGCGNSSDDVSKWLVAFRGSEVRTFNGSFFLEPLTNPPRN